MPPSGLDDSIFAICPKDRVLSRSTGSHNAIQCDAEVRQRARLPLIPSYWKVSLIGDNPIMLLRIVDVRAMSPARRIDACEGAQCFVMRSTTRTMVSSRSSVRKLSTWGVTQGRLGCVRSLTRSSPDNNRSDPIRSRPGDNDKRVSLRPASTANDRCPATSANFPWCRKPAERRRNARIEISSSACDGTRDRHRSRRTPTAHLRLSAPRPLCPPRDNTGSQNASGVGSFTIKSAKAIVNFIKARAVSSRDD